MKPARLPLPHLVSRLRPCQSSRLGARTCLAALTRQTLPSSSAACARLVFLPRRFLATESTPPNAPSQQNPPEAAAEVQPQVPPQDEVYYGPLASTYRRLKIFSLSTLSLTFALTPFIFLIEATSSIPVIARFTLAGMAMAASGVSTSLVAWVGRPYVSTLRWLKPEEGTQGAGSGHAVEMTTLTLALHPRVTTVYDTAFLVPTSRPFATWELAEAFRLPEAEVANARKEGLIPREETIAETRTIDGVPLGSWVVSWDEHGVGTCRAIGKVSRYFNVHQELLGRPIR